jgi:hypothetical protein
MVPFKEKKLKNNCNRQNVGIGDKTSFVRFEVLTAVTVKVKILWDVVMQFGGYLLTDISEKPAVSINKVEMTETSLCSEMSVHIYHMTWHHIPGDMPLQGVFPPGINNNH